MGEDPVGGDAVPGDDVAGKGLYRRHLSLGEVPVAEIVPGIVDLDADRAGVDVPFSRPDRYPRVPGAPVLLDHRDDMPVRVDEIVAAHLGPGIAQPGNRLLRARHAGIMQDHHGGHGTLAPRSMIVARPADDPRKTHQSPRSLRISS
jgi:hypothetical protein